MDEKKEIQKFSEEQIALGIDKLDAYLSTLKEWQKKLFAQLDKYDYKEPYEGAEMKILTFSGARKLGKILRVSVELKEEEYIKLGDEIAGVRVLLRVSLPNGDFVDMNGYCGNDEPASRKTKRSVYQMSSIAYKRAFVKAIKLLLGLPDFADEVYEESEEVPEKKDIPVETIEKKFDITDKQLIFLVDLYLKRHLNRDTAEKVMSRLIELAKSGELNSHSVSSAIDYLTKYKKKQDYDESWNNVSESERVEWKIAWVKSFLKAIGRENILNEILGEKINDFPF